MANAEATINVRLMDIPEVKRALDSAERALLDNQVTLLRLAQAIYKAEFADDGACPFCSGYDGHAPDCAMHLAKAILAGGLPT